MAGFWDNTNNIIEKYHKIRTNSAILGIAIPIGFGQNRLTAKLIWYGDFVAATAKQQGGSGLGKGGGQYVYTAAVLAVLVHGPVTSLKSVWDATGKFFVDTVTETYVVTSPYTYTTNFAAAFVADHGTAAQTSYSYDVYDYGSAPTTLSGTTGVALTPVVSAPISGQYSVDATTGIYTFAAADVGTSIQIAYSYYRYTLLAEELDVVPFSPGPYTVTVDNVATFDSDFGVQYYPAGGYLEFLLSGTPTLGQYRVSDGTYTFSSSDAGQGIVINYTYQDPNTDVNAPNKINLTLIEGEQGQAPWSYLSSKHPDQALGYTEVGMIGSSAMYMGYSPELPNYTYEIAMGYQVGGGIIDANPVDCILQLLSNPVYGIGFPFSSIGDTSLARNCWRANSFFISPLLENQNTTANILSEWLKAGMVAGFWSEGLLKFVPYCDTSIVGNGILYQPPTTPVANIDDDDLLSGSSKSGGPVLVTRTPWMDAYNRVQVTYAARVNDYNPELMYAQDEGSVQRFGLRVQDPLEWDFITTLTAAQYSATMWLQRNVYVRNTYEFMLPTTFSYLEPMDIVTLTDNFLGLIAKPVRIQKIADDPSKGLQITAEDFIWGSASAAFTPGAVNTPAAPPPGQQDPGDTEVLLIQIPNRLALQQGDMVYGWCFGTNANWGGCHVWVSYDGTTYTELKNRIFNSTTVNAQPRIGQLTATFPSAAVGPDTTDTLKVTMSNDQALPSFTAIAAENYTSLCALLNGTTLELISYTTATLVGNGAYDITDTYRGVYGTTPASFPAGSFFALVQDASFAYQFDPQYFGSTIYLKFTSFNLLNQNEQSLADVEAETFVLENVNKGVIDLDTAAILSGVGSVPPSLTSSFTYTSTTTSITWSWSSFTILRADGTTTSVPDGSQGCTGLTSSTPYYFYPYYDEITQALLFAGGGRGTPAIAYLGQSLIASQVPQESNHIALASGSMMASTTSSGGGSGGGGGSTVCVRETMLVESKTRGYIPVGTVEVGEEINDINGWQEVKKKLILSWSTWIRVTVSSGEVVDIVPTHKVETYEHGITAAQDLTLNHRLFGREGLLLISKLEVVDEKSAKVMLLVEPDHTFLCGAYKPDISIHNNIPVPS